MYNIAARAHAHGCDGQCDDFYYDAAERLIEMVEPARLVRPRQHGRSVPGPQPLVLDPFHDQVHDRPGHHLLDERLRQVVLQIARPTAGGSPPVTIRHLYDAAGNLVRHTDGNDNDTATGGYAGRTISQIQAIEYLSFSGEITQTLLRHFATTPQAIQTDVMDSYTVMSRGPAADRTRLNYRAFGEVTGQYKVWGAANMAIADIWPRHPTRPGGELRFIPRAPDPTGRPGWADEVLLRPGGDLTARSNTARCPTAAPACVSRDRLR